jgi:hypothetical protein
VEELRWRPSKYPLYQAAEDALQAEKAAKTSVYNRQSKNALNFLDKTIPWPKFAVVRDHQQKLLSLVEPGEGQASVSRNLIRRLSQLYIEYEQTIRAQAEAGQETRAYWGHGQWYSAYGLTRLAKQHKDFTDDILALRDELGLENFTNIEWIGPAARWVELLTRKGV